MKSIREKIEEMKHYDEEKDIETDEPATLEEKFSYLLDLVDEIDVQAHNTAVGLDDFEKKWMNHRHSVDALYSGKAER